MNVCCFTPSYYEDRDALDDERFARLKQAEPVDQVHHLYRGTVQPEAEISGVRHHLVTDATDRLSAILSFVSTVRSYVAVQDIDLLYCFDYRLLPPIATAGTLTRLPLVFECGNRWEHGFDTTSDRCTWIPVLKALFRSGAVDEVVALADHLDRSVQKLGASETRTIYPLMNKGPFLNCESAVTYSEEQVVLYVGRISPEKGPQHLLEHFDALQRSDVGLHFIGDNINDIGERTELARRIRSRAATSDRIHYHGWVDYANLPPYYLGADIVALPSRTEGFPAVIGESLSTETPVVCSDIPAFREIIDESFGRIADVGSPAFTEAIAALLDDPELRAEMGTAGREFVLRESTRSQRGLDSLFARYA